MVGTNSCFPLFFFVCLQDEKIECCRFSRDGMKPFLFCTVAKGAFLIEPENHVYSEFKTVWFLTCVHPWCRFESCYCCLGHKWLEENWVQKTSGKAYLHTFSKLGRKVSGTVSGNTYTVIMYSCYVTMWVLLAFLGTCTPSKCGINILQTLFPFTNLAYFSVWFCPPCILIMCSTRI